MNAPKIDFQKHRVDVFKALTTDPAPLDFIWPGFLAGTVGTLFAPGATSKSFWTIQAAVAVATGIDTVGITPGGLGRVVYLAAEDPTIVLQHRLRAISLGKGFSPDDAGLAQERIDLLSLVGQGLNLGDDEQRGELIEYCKGSRLVIIDTISRAHRLDENSNGEMAQLLMFLEMIAGQTGAAILFLHHIAKAMSRAGEGDSQHAARGAGALTDNARMGSALSRMTASEAEQMIDRNLGSVEPIGPDSRARYVRMSIPKNNYSAPIADRWYRRDGGGVLTPVDLTEAEKMEELKAAKACARRGLANIMGRGADGFDARHKAAAPTGAGGEDDDNW
jgi:hypothetical protein